MSKPDLLSLQGELCLAKIVNGVAGALLPVGNMPTLKLKISSDKVDHYDSRYGQRAKDATLYKQTVVDVGQFDQGDIGGKAKRLFHQEEQGIGEQQQHSVNDEISVHASVDFCQVVFCNQLESKVDGSVGQYDEEGCPEQLRPL